MKILEVFTFHFSPLASDLSLLTSRFSLLASNPLTIFLMKPIYSFFLGLAVILAACNPMEPAVAGLDEDYPFRLILDADEGGDLPGAEDYSLDVEFADFIGDLPSEAMTLTYDLRDLNGDFDVTDGVLIDEVIYKVEIDDCEFERELAFDGSTITLAIDPDLGTVPEAFEVVFALNGESGAFTFEITDLQTSSNVLLNDVMVFEYETFDSDIAGEWTLDLNEATFTRFQDLFGTLSGDLAGASFSEIDPALAAEFSFEEVKFEIERLETEPVCEDGETEEEAKTIELEAEYEAEEGEIEAEGSYIVVEDDAEIEELDFIFEGEYEISPDGETLTLTITRLINEDDFAEGEELFSGSETFVFQRD